MAAPTTVLTIVKKMTYRGSAEEWSNQYALSGTTPVDSPAWKTLFDLLVVEEKKLYTGDISVVAGYGYNKIPETGDHAVWSVDMTVSPNTPVLGTLAVPTAQAQAGDAAAWIRWGLDRFNTKGKRVYLRKYYHGVFATAAIPADVLCPPQVTAYTAFAGKMRDGSFTGGRVITDRLGTAVVGAAVSPYITTRTLKRRGKRPGS